MGDIDYARTIDINVYQSVLFSILRTPHKPNGSPLLPYDCYKSRTEKRLERATRKKNVTAVTALKVHELLYLSMISPW